MLSLAILFACNDDNPADSAKNISPDTLHVSVEGDQNLNFASNTVNFIEYGSGTARLSAAMIKSVTETYQVQIEFKDTAGVMEFDLKDSGPLTKFEKRNLTLVTDSYAFNVEGKISFTHKSSDSLRGSFYFNATTADTVTGGAKSVILTKGEFFYTKHNDSEYSK